MKNTCYCVSQVEKDGKTTEEGLCLGKFSEIKRKYASFTNKMKEKVENEKNVRKQPFCSCVLTC